MKAFPWIVAGVAVGIAVYVATNSSEPLYAGSVPELDVAANKASVWGTKQRVKGTGQSLVGKAKEGVGRIAGDDELAGEGVLDQVTGKVKDAAGKAAHAVSDTLHDLNK
jgi:uncharacterized protein YjbJ (UPF0337 family)